MVFLPPPVGALPGLQQRLGTHVCNPLRLRVNGCFAGSVSFAVFGDREGNRISLPFRGRGKKGRLGVLWSDLGFYSFG